MSPPLPLRDLSGPSRGNFPCRGPQFCHWEPAAVWGPGAHPLHPRGIRSCCRCAQPWDLGLHSGPFLPASSFVFCWVDVEAQWRQALWVPSDCVEQTPLPTCIRGGGGGVGNTCSQR